MAEYCEIHSEYRFLNSSRHNIDNFGLGRCGTSRSRASAFRFGLSFRVFIGGRMYRFVMNSEFVMRCKFKSAVIVTAGELFWRVWRMFFATMEIQFPLCSILFVTIFSRTSKSAERTIENVFVSVMGTI